MSDDREHFLDVGLRVATARELRGFSNLTDLCVAAGISLATLSRIESGERNASQEMLERLLTALDMSAEEFFTLNIGVDS